MLIRPAHAACATALLTALLVMAPSAGAVQITIDLDTGVYDPSITPTTGTHCPCDYLEDGARFAGFWAEEVGTPGGYHQLGHTHIASHNSPGTTGLAERQHPWTNALQGNRITLENGGSFNVISIDYRIRKRTSNDPAEQPLPWSFGPNDVQMLLALDFDPTLPDFEGQWTPFDIDPGGSLPPDLPWQTQTITGFDGITELFLSSTGFVSFDNIVLELIPAAVPEPSTGLLVGIGLVGLAARRRR